MSQASIKLNGTETRLSFRQRIQVLIVGRILVNVYLTAGQNKSIAVNTVISVMGLGELLSRIPIFDRLIKFINHSKIYRKVENLKAKSAELQSSTSALLQQASDLQAAAESILTLSQELGSEVTALEQRLAVQQEKVPAESEPSPEPSAPEAAPESDQNDSPEPGDDQDKLAEPTPEAEQPAAEKAPSEEASAEPASDEPKPTLVDGEEPVGGIDPPTHPEVPAEGPTDAAPAEGEAPTEDVSEGPANEEAEAPSEPGTDAPNESGEETLVPPAQ